MEKENSLHQQCKKFLKGLCLYRRGFGKCRECSLNHCKAISCCHGSWEIRNKAGDLVQGSAGGHHCDTARPLQNAENARDEGSSCRVWAKTALEEVNNSQASKARRIRAAGGGEQGELGCSKAWEDTPVLDSTPLYGGGEGVERKDLHFWVGPVLREGF